MVSSGVLGQEPTYRFGIPLRFWVIILFQRL